MARLTSPIPEGAETSINDYYDIMVIGRTGMGKSTTSDKLLMANLAGLTCHRGVQNAGEALSIEQVKLGDFSMWMISDAEDEFERVTIRLKNLVMFQGLEKPYEGANSMYKGSKKPTLRSQLVSNEITKVRILDVPGFFGKDACTDRVYTIGNMVTLSGLSIMREVLRIQSTMRMKFKRIIYFIPERGPLERSHKVLLMELEQMVHYFGRSIFECMVLVATVNPDIYRYIPENILPFSDDAKMTTRVNFQEALTQLLPQEEQLPGGKLPIVFISMHDSCEAIMAKIKDAAVLRSEFRLAFDHRTCVRCGLKAKILTYKNNKKKRVACYLGQDPSVSIPYEESLCHPMIVSKYWTITKIVGGIAHFITRRKYEGKWPDFRNPDDEVCIECGRIPGETGCKVVGSRYEKYEEVIIVDHSPTDPVVFVEADEQQPLPPAMEGENAASENPTEQDIAVDQQQIRDDTRNIVSTDSDRHQHHKYSQERGNTAAAVNDSTEPVSQPRPVGDGMQIDVAVDIEGSDSVDEHQQCEQPGTSPVGEGESVRTRLGITENQLQQQQLTKSGACGMDSELDVSGLSISEEQPQPQPIHSTTES